MPTYPVATASRLCRARHGFKSRCHKLVALEEAEQTLHAQDMPRSSRRRHLTMLTRHCNTKGVIRQHI
jgi:hypothetical protein